MVRRPVEARELHNFCPHPSPSLDPGVDGLKRLRLTPKLFDW